MYTLDVLILTSALSVNRGQFFPIYLPSQNTATCRGFTPNPAIIRRFLADRVFCVPSLPARKAPKLSPVFHKPPPSSRPSSIGGLLCPSTGWAHIPLVPVLLVFPYHVVCPGIFIHERTRPARTRPVPRTNTCQSCWESRSTEVNSPNSGSRGNLPILMGIRKGL